MHHCVALCSTHKYNLFLWLWHLIQTQQRRQKTAGHSRWQRGFSLSLAPFRLSAMNGGASCKLLMTCYVPPPSVLSQSPSKCGSGINIEQRLPSLQGLLMTAGHADQMPSMSYRNISRLSSLLMFKATIEAGGRAFRAGHSQSLDPNSFDPHDKTCFWNDKQQRAM